MKLKTCAASAAVLFISISSAYAEYPARLFSVSQLHFDSVTEARGFVWYLRTREAEVILDSIAGYMGIDPQYVSLALRALPTKEIRGEESFYGLPLARGYKYCASRVGVRSIMSVNGHDSVLGVTPGPDALAIYTFTPGGGLFEGQSSVEGDAQLVGIKPEYFEEFLDKGVCAELPGGALLSCKGNPCPGYEHGHYKDLSSTHQVEGTPDLKGGF
jgi:hypothetical protein